LKAAHRNASAAILVVGFAWRSLVRQPARASLGVLGVAAVGALLFDMLLLSEGLVLSMRDLLDRTGWDVRVSVGDDPPSVNRSARIHDVRRVLREVSALPSVDSAIAIRLADATVEGPAGNAAFAFLQGISDTPRMPWTVARGADPAAPDHIVVNDALADALAIGPGSVVTVRASCTGGMEERRQAVPGDREALPPVRFTVTGIVTFPFQEASEGAAAGSLGALARACAGTGDDQANVLLVASTGDPAAAAAAIHRARPGLTAVTNEDLVGRLQQTGFTYFRQISTVLTTVTLSFAVLLITVLLTVSVNQRLGEIAALRAFGFSRGRVAADVISESLLIVGSGGVLSLPLGLALASGLDRILKRMPGIPEALHFFVFEERALVVHAALLAATAVAAALYPVRIVTALPIASTLRDEVVG
jgi:putative ABC transport system permease protein